MMCYLTTCAPPTNAPVQNMCGVNVLEPAQELVQKVLAVLVRKSLR